MQFEAQKSKDFSNGWQGISCGEQGFIFVAAANSAQTVFESRIRAETSAKPAARYELKRSLEVSLAEATIIK